MGIYLRKSIRVGPMRFNLSKGGVGVSVGVKGFRVGSGPRGNYVHMGAHGIYYRTTIPSLRQPPASACKPSGPPPLPLNTDPVTPDGTVGRWSTLTPHRRPRSSTARLKRFWTSSI